ncbi:DUF2442 domain-containing protein [endosymbiont GvMRE of Glomus versiforme]|uniref:DUF2442 domain-containing protein n=1 Tax=endosymbiont GvMRE of Glomus versiforme TaxID=2039283 RepID=UPI000EC346FC|nr:DUF2442 domain-containing protein [endosymbiont GvMRE of Glomus versiforme]RHZ37388.1 hypothetical protein GvMRE_I1g549 [endosymbiont GvMRE of Glomus versiforme]
MSEVLQANYQRGIKYKQEKNICFSCQKEISKKDHREHHYFVRKEGIYHSKCYNGNDEKEKNSQIKEANNWEEIIKNYPCSNCDYNFSEEELRKKNWQVIYWADKYYASEKNPCQEEKEIYNIKHLNCLGSCWCERCKKAYEEIKKSDYCWNCRKKLGNLVIVSKLSETTYHPECWERGETFPIVYKWHTHPRLLELKVNQTKITAYLDDGREISIPISKLAKRWQKPDLTTKQLEKYEIDERERFSFHFPDADVDDNVLAFAGKNCGCC